MRNDPTFQVEFAVLGAGALGSLIGAHLARSGHNVALLARNRRASQIVSDGVTIRGLADFTAKIPVITDPRLLQSASTLIVATKAISTVAALAPLQRAQIGAAFSIQNGVMKNELLSNAFGAEHVLGAIANTSAELLSSGAVMFTRNVKLLVGEFDGALSARAQHIAAAIDSSGVHAEVSQDIRSREWSKFAAWVGLLALSVTTRRHTWQYLCDAGGALVFVRLVREVQRLADAIGVELVDDHSFPVATICRESDEQATNVVMNIGREFHRSAPSHRVSSLQDLEAGRRLELDETLGYACRKATQLKLDLPLLASVSQLLGAIDSMQLGSG